jgi:cytochrome c-type biogenesis protein CcmH
MSRRSPATTPRIVAGALLASLAMATATTAAANATAAGANMTAPRAKTSLPQIERQVMCVTCKIPLILAQSPQADRERAFIQSQIDRGRSEAQIKQALVDQYGHSVLGLPAEHGFDLVAYLVPLAVVLALLAALALLLPRWRRRAREHSGEQGAAGPEPTASTVHALDPDDAARLDSDLARFDR